MKRVNGFPNEAYYLKVRPPPCPRGGQEGTIGSSVRYPSVGKVTLFSEEDYRSYIQGVKRRNLPFQ